VCGAEKKPLKNPSGPNFAVYKKQSNKPLNWPGGAFIKRVFNT